MGTVLQTDGLGTLTWTVSLETVVAMEFGGSNTQVQFNNAGTFAGDAGFTLTVTQTF
jgi:hypothetical protein